MYKVPKPKQFDQPNGMEKAIAVASYISFGLVGFVWILIGAIKQQNLRHFLKYHIYQSIFLSVLYAIVFFTCNLILQILFFIPFIGKLASLIHSLFTYQWVFFFRFSIVDVFIIILLIYLSVTTLQGKYSFIPWVSNIIKYNVERG